MAMLTRMQTGKFKVFKHLNDWFNRKDGLVVKEGDDLMAATRYAIMTLRYTSTKRTYQDFRRPLNFAIACGFSLNLIYLWFTTPGGPPVALEDKPPVDKANDAGPQPDEVSGKQGLTPNCEKEVRRTADLLRFFANRIQTGEEIQSVVGDMRQQEKRIAAVCPD
jgi:hypothetical protein